jgi:hypothetical protein
MFAAMVDFAVDWRAMPVFWVMLIDRTWVRQGAMGHGGLANDWRSARMSPIICVTLQWYSGGLAKASLRGSIDSNHATRPRVPRMYLYNTLVFKFCVPQT